MKFSERKGLTPVRMEIQRESIDEPLKNKLWSGINLCFFDLVEKKAPPRKNSTDIAQVLWIHFFCRPVDEAPGKWRDLRAEVRRWFFTARWYEIYDFIEALVSFLPEDRYGKLFTKTLNAFLEQELSAYRIVAGKITEITSETEIESVERAIADSDRLSGVNTHLRAALAKFSDRNTPDYRNSIKESISAVEAACQAISGDDAATLAKALKNWRTREWVYIPPSERDGPAFTDGPATMVGFGTPFLKEASSPKPPRRSICWSLARPLSAT